MRHVLEEVVLLFSSSLCTRKDYIIEYSEYPEYPMPSYTTTINLIHVLEEVVLLFYLWRNERDLRDWKERWHNKFDSSSFFRLRQNPTTIPTINTTTSMSTTPLFAAINHDTCAT